MNLFVLVLEIVGTVAFSISGAMIAMKKNMDIFGVMILGLTTAVGGGVIRDLILGITPPSTFRNPVYAIAALITAAIVFLPQIRRLFRKFQYAYDHLLLIMDSVGLGIFTVIGVRAAMLQPETYSFFLLIFVGVITGVGGGVLRDTMAQHPPYIFVKHIYASASILGAVLCAGLWNTTNETVSMTVGALAVVIIRLLSAHFRWSLPKAKME